MTRSLPRALAAVLVLTVASAVIAVALLRLLWMPPSASPGSVFIHAVTVISDQHLLAVGSTGSWQSPAAVARTTDGGRQWTVTAEDVPALMYVTVAGTRIVASRYCLPASVGGPTGDSLPSCLFASEDGGSTWVDLHAGALVDPTFADASYGWAHTQFGRELSETFDGGLSWSLVDRPCPAEYPFIHGASATERGGGYLLCFAEATEAGQPWSLIRKSATGGTTPVFGGVTSNGEPQQGLRDEVLKGFSMRADGSGLMWTSELYRTTDGGHTWTLVPTAGLEGGSFGFGGFVIDADNGYLIWGTTSSSSVIEVRPGEVLTLATWPMSIVGGAETSAP